ncbi:hypothetical protein FDV58_35205 [Bradyrhizobium elkanii]|uniref:Uncharacterized protein n=1 Tax=Bradyrhizobium elkanii TaxID=29448 RepID=A0A4U6RHW1_BRAEL|nr:hypothetical protein FDV58_35205 [Bradyrhizobium elkanii]
MFLYKNITWLSEVAGALLPSEEIEEFTNLSPGCLRVTGLSSSHEMFEFGEDLLDRQRGVEALENFRRQS